MSKEAIEVIETVVANLDVLAGYENVGSDVSERIRNNMGYLNDLINAIKLDDELTHLRIAQATMRASAAHLEGEYTGITFAQKTLGLIKEEFDGSN
jgi:hypothetical protein